MPIDRAIAVVLLSTCALMVAPVAAAEGDIGREIETQARWAQFRGPNAGGVVDDQPDLPVELGREKNVRWKTELPPGASSPCIWGNRVFVTAFDIGAEQLEVICIDRADGEVLWRRDIGAKVIEKVHVASTPASGTPATDGERVYVYFGSRGLLCYDVEGDLKWVIEMPVPQMRNGSGTSPILAGDLVLLNRDLSTDPHLLAVNKVSGEVVWKHPHLFAPGMLTEGYATPILWKDQVILHTHEGMRSIRLADGQLVWQANVQTTGCATPVISGNTLFVATWQNLGEPSLRQELPSFDKLVEHDTDADGVIAFEEFPGKYLLFDRPEAADEKGVRAPVKMLLGMVDQNSDRSITRQEWTGFIGRFQNFISDHGLLAIKLGGQGDVTESHVTILEKRNIPEVPSPLVHKGRIYMVKNGGILTCLDESSGDVLFRKRIGASGSYYASPIAVGDRIFLASGQGVITVLRASDKLDVIAENDLAERIMSTPAAVDNTLYVRTMDHLYAFSSTDR